MNTPEEKKPSHRLKVPEGVSPAGPVMDIAEAYTRAMISLPAILEDIADSLGLIAMYFEKKGIADGILSNEDVEGDANEQQPD